MSGFVDGDRPQISLCELRGTVHLAGEGTLAFYRQRLRWWRVAGEGLPATRAA
ncbi:hypothetical protein [Chelatococcus asaccharovorans]|uniref:hypothetical protein n=1 Tax=Chelatococcus asaccharovorans TaxID=28210 RepID=UPI001473B4B0|nr:hypothetical protein [Chelatococcus asaccharovorans]MBS7704747.1 hypothetical protein [Chelatococcus asaccharovorans]